VAVSPFDNEVYYLRRTNSSNAGGLYRLEGQLDSTRIAAITNPAGLVADPVTGDLFVSEDFPGQVRRYAPDGSSNSFWLSGFLGGDDDPAGMSYIPSSYTGSLVTPGEMLLADRGFNGLESLWTFSPATAQSASFLLSESTRNDALYGCFTTKDKVIGVDSAIGLREMTGPPFVLGPALTTTPLVGMESAIWDPVRDVIYATVLETNATARLVQVDLESDSVTEIATGLVGPRWNALSLNPDASELWVADFGSGELSRFALPPVGSCPPAAPLLRPDNVSFVSSEFDLLLDATAQNTINGSGLPPNFTATDAHDPYGDGNHWTTNIGEAATDTQIAWSFQEPQDLTSIVLWNHQASPPLTARDDFEVTRFRLFFLDEENVLIRSVLDLNLRPDLATGQVIHFDEPIKGVTQVSFLVDATQGSPEFTGLGEVAFNAPLPKSFSAPAVAYSANTAWVNLAPCDTGVVVTDRYLYGFAFDPNCGWIKFGSPTPDNGYHFSNTAQDHGVNHDGKGNLSGYAWSANTGWFSFDWASPSDPNRPRFDLQTGRFSGYAWNANTGWLNLGANLLSVTEMVRLDRDNDGISDSWEFEQFGDLATAQLGTDFDRDGSLDADESLALTDPRDVNDSFNPIISVSPDLFMINFSFPSSTQRLYQIESSTDLGLLNPWMPEGEPVPGTDSVLVLPSTRNASPPTNFFRLRITTPLNQHEQP
jgi:hypothetical protein